MAATSPTTARTTRTTGTNGPPGRAAARRIERYNRATRWYHAVVYLLTLPLLFTGWWLLTGKEGEPSPLARLTGAADVTIHEYLGWALAGAGVLGLVIGARATGTFLRESSRFARGDGRWLARWPGAAFTGRFGPHEGHFDPGQRIANVVLAGSLLALVVSGIGLVNVSGGPAFVWFSRVHEYSTYVAAVFIGGHVVVGSGLLPGYRGVWRSMHGRGGGIDLDTARRLWPGWTERTLTRPGTSRPKTRRTD